MIEVKLEQLDANSEHTVLVEWYYSNNEVISKDSVICTVETSKATFDILAPANGILVQRVAEGDDLDIGAVLAIIAENEDEADSINKDLKQSDVQRDEEKKVEKRQVIEYEEVTLKITQKAKQIMKDNNVSPEVFKGKALVTAEDVNKYLNVSMVMPSAPQVTSPEECNRVLIVTARIGGMQVLDILLNNPLINVVGFVDDDPSLAGTRIWGIPILDTFNNIESLWNNKKFDSAIIGYSTTVAIRKKLFDKCVSLGIPMVNAIDPSARINRACALGQGNVICSHVHVGIATVLGNNNVVSANSSIDHHNKWGSHILIGPNCVTSGDVEIEDEVRFGMGIFVQPQLKLGKGSVVSSGGVLTTSVPPNHIVKVNYSQQVKLLQ